MDVLGWLLAAHALHLGFQLTVTSVVYPALADTAPETWDAVHAAHARRITPVVGLTYAVLAGASGWALLVLLGVVGPAATHPTLDAVGRLGVGLALLGAAGAAGATALGAAPTHGRLGGGHDADLVRRLLLQDRLRCAAAVVGALGALTAVVAASGPS